MSDTRPPEQRKNSYSDEDLAKLVDAIEEVRDDSADIMASARGKAMNNAKREQNLIKMGEQQNRIPPKIVKAVLRQRVLERAQKKNAESVGDDLTEVYVDASAQMSLFKVEEGQPVKNTATAAAEAVAAEARKNEEDEQEEGARVLEGLAGDQS